MIATAFVATLWGLLSANFIWLPIGGRLKRLVGSGNRADDPADGRHAGGAGR